MRDTYPASSFGRGSSRLEGISRPDWASLHNVTAILLYTRTKSSYIVLDTVSHTYCPSDAGSEYVPSFKAYVAWQQQQQQIGSIKLQKETVALPAGFLDHPQYAMVWKGCGVQESKWAMLLNESHLQKIDNALHFFQGQLAHHHHPPPPPPPHPPHPPSLELMTALESLFRPDVHPFSYWSHLYTSLLIEWEKVTMVRLGARGRSSRYSGRGFAVFRGTKNRCLGSLLDLQSNSSDASCLMRHFKAATSAAAEQNIAIRTVQFTSRPTHEENTKIDSIGADILQHYTNPSV